MSRYSKESLENHTYLAAPAQIAPDIYAFGETQHTLTANPLVYQDIIFDPGSLHTLAYFQTQLIPLLRARRILTQPQVSIFLTHAHADHVGCVASLKDWLNTMGKTVTVFAPKGIQTVVGANHPLSLAKHLYPSGSHLPFPVDYELEDGAQLHFPHALIESFLVPGHTNHDMAYRLTTPQTSILYLGDALEGGLAPAYDSCLPAQVDARARLAELKADAYIGSHGWPHIPLTLAGLYRLSTGLAQTPSDLYPGFGGVLSPSQP